MLLSRSVEISIEQASLGWWFSFTFCVTSPRNVLFACQLCPFVVLCLSFSVKLNCVIYFYI